uniref:TBC1 domain family member 5 n=1 Tax=Cacopsylla melanoneura TaxID=428564 RepID=A0A8D9DYU4_9HEMI
MSEPEEIAQEVDEDAGQISGDYRQDNMSAFLKYTFEWKCFYNEEYFEEIHKNSLHGELRASSFRSVCWQILLNILTYPDSKKKKPSAEVGLDNENVPKPSSLCPGECPDEADQKSIVEKWSEHISQCRKEYEELKQSLELDPTLSLVDNPLSQNTESVWYKHFCDTELKTVIRQDVVRTFPGLDFFRNNEHIQQLMVAILFCYARKYPQMCYRQGMHEILAPIIFVLHCDHQALLHALEVSPVDEHLTTILNEHYLEHDAFTIFCKVMASIENYYLINDSTPTSSGYFPPNPNNSLSSITDNHVVSQLYFINEHILKPADPALHAQLYNLKIPLTLFGIRWLRLLFGREFSLQDLLVLWDVIFAESFELVNYVVVAMLVAIRDQVISSDHIECLSYLMRYPPGIDVNSIIEHALHLKYPNLYPEYEPSPSPEPTPATDSNTKKAKKKNKEKRYKFLNIKSRNKMNPTGPDIMEALPIAEETENTVSAHSQLAYYRDIMIKCHSKLSECSTRIECNQNHSKAPVMNQVLRDIKQVCSLLEVAHLSPPRTPRSLIEFASEANESRSSPQPLQTKGVHTLRNASQSNVSTESKAVKHLVEEEEEDDDLPLNLPPPKSSVDMTTFSCTKMSEGEEGGAGDFPASYPHPTSCG